MFQFPTSSLETIPTISFEYIIYTCIWELQSILYFHSLYLLLDWPVYCTGKGPGSPPAITIDLDNHGKLHRPVPVHMSRLLEDDKEQEEKEGTQEINRNYKQYSKASPVSRKEQAEEQNDEQEKMSSSSDSSTPLGEGHWYINWRPNKHGSGRECVHVCES